jgi:hypothetical protein
MPQHPGGVVIIAEHEHDIALDIPAACTTSVSELAGAAPAVPASANRSRARSRGSNHLPTVPKRRHPAVSRHPARHRRVEHPPDGHVRARALPVSGSTSSACHSPRSAASANNRTGRPAPRLDRGTRAPTAVIACASVCGETPRTYTPADVRLLQMILRDRGLTTARREHPGTDPLGDVAHVA